MGRGFFAFLALLWLGACAGQPADEEPEAGVIMQWPDLLDRDRPRPDAQISYGDDPLQLVDVWIPKSDGPHPAVIMIHGGCWQTAIAERDIMNWIAEDLRKDGIGVWNIEYRGVDRGGGYPGTFEDVGAAADLFMTRGAEFGLDTRRRVAIGHSAGGHLALWLAMRPALDLDEPLRGQDPIRIDTAISQGGLPDLRAGEKREGHPCGTEAPAQMAGGRYALTSPPEMPAAPSKQVLFNNDQDHVAPPKYAEAYRQIMERRGLPVETHVGRNAGHVELIAPETESWAAQKAAIRTALGI